FPDTPVIAVTVAIRSTVADWEQFLVDLAPSITKRTLIVQSTDFSHYLPLAEAIRRDQEVLNLLSAGDIEGIARLDQPKHIDSRGGQYIQMRLQAEHFRTRPVVIANANLEDYTGRTETETTSYIVQIFPAPEDAATVDDAGYVDGEIICFAGDTFFGRYMAPLLSQEEVRAELLRTAASILKGCPLIVNLEGVMVPEIPTGLGPVTLAMPQELTLSWIDALNIRAVGLANNHSGDLGPAARSDMIRALRGAGVEVVEAGQTVDLGPLRLVGLSDLSNTERPATERITDDDLDLIMRSDARPPLAAFVHWGREFEVLPGARELHLANSLRRAAVSLIVGAHPHVAGEGIAALAGGEAQLVYSLGNLLFDQPGEQSSGAVLEVRFFPQGTFFTRLLPIPNLYDTALAARPAVDLN
ncbi:MAG: AmmeMemoRadiSam system protein B, partial [Hyphomicrobiales bacterium]|nr:AmmeMemoRadiSam system protein B [Hyphomicrobiales bacterium]